METIIHIELSILNAIYSLHNPMLDKIMVFITHLGDKGFIWIAIGLIMCFIKKYRKACVCMLLALLINLIIGNIILKPLIARIRPFECIDGIKLLIEKPLDYSFPSGHTFSSFAAATAMYLNCKKEGAVLFVIASLIALSRLYLYVHFPTDVLFGVIFGIGVGCISKYITDKYFKIA